MMMNPRYRRLVKTIIGGDHLDLDTLLELMSQSNWTEKQVELELGSGVMDLYRKINEQ